MELFIALFGGLYLLIKVLNEKIGHQLTKKANDMRLQTIERWVDSVHNKELEGEIDLFLNDPNNRQAMFNEVVEVYDQIFKEYKLAEIYPNKYWSKSKVKGMSDEEYTKLVVCYDKRNAKRIMMAKKGYYQFWDAGLTQVRLHIDPPEHTHKTFSSKLEVLVMQWCAEEISKHGARGEFVVPSCTFAGSSTAHWVI